ncbi:glycosyltransferase family 2 protein [Xanthobacter tagetidis]|uniref:Glycosyltransferase family 2 protein n=1 Tax=Xanthobacter tagetidis TaxID=60216 RepID=A0A3L7AL47_9HYPH|nr:glycosyltransferase family 2 protein [Xanthobacter tagetidis]MBB6306824.1 hypothetical protein [Xanthobacter tagetidis]RLP80102.1 glycosyltransferase family 2 protein [Xanthobacter tagetidis]
MAGKPDAARPAAPSVAICAIFRDEAPYVLEWVAHHRALGIDHIFVFDNESRDGTSELLDRLSTLGFLTRIPFPDDATSAPQPRAYARMLEIWPAHVDFVAFIDADEFIYPDRAGFDLKGWIGARAADPAVGAIGLNWCTYGSAGEIAFSPRAVLERFQHRSERHHEVNPHVKTLLRRGAGLACINPHAFMLRDGLRYVHADGQALRDCPEIGPGGSQDVVWGPVRLNHYPVKSRQEFFHRKRLKASAALLSRQKDLAYFQIHDANAVRDVPHRALLSRAARLRRRYARHVAGLSWPRSLLSRPERHPLLARIGALFPALTPAQRTALAAWSPTLPPLGAGFLDQCEVQGDVLRLEGWAFGPDGAPIDAFAVVVDGEAAANFALRRVDRPDVPVHYPGATGASGFEIELPLPTPLRPGAEIMVRGRSAGRQEMPALAEGRWGG